MLRKSGKFVCGGSLISTDWVLTAAHCLHDNPDPSIYTVEVGAHRRLGTTPIQKRLAIASLWLHSNFSTVNLRNDIALLLLNETVNITSKIRPIKLPRQGKRINAGKTCYITGWGRLSGEGIYSDVLQEAPLDIGGESSCRSTNGPNYDSATMICAGAQGKGECEGDSGGPLSCYEGNQWIVRGVVSWGKDGCLPNYYAVFARVSNYVAWISKIKDQRGNINCTFEDNQPCQSWIQDKSDKFDWTGKQGPTSSPGTGPSTDHTTGSGHYMYINTAHWKIKSGDKARLYGGILNNTEKLCLSFWYHMYGRDIGALRVLTRGRQKLSTVWSRKGPSGNRWLQGKTTLTARGEYWLIFEARSGSGKEGNIAIDDIALTKGSCSISQSCRDQTCYNKGNAYCLNNTGYCYCQSGSYGQQCESLSYNCSFDGGLCSLWDQDTTDDFDWTRYQGSTVNRKTGPSRDHTTGSGSYYYLETSFSRFGDKARLISKTFPATKDMCFTFWYHMYGKDINTLRILLKKASQQIVVWSRKIQSGLDRWLEGKVTLSSDDPFKVVIEGIAGNGYLGEIAIDDVSFVSGTCSVSKSCRDQTCYNDGHAYCLNNTGHCYCPDDSIGQQCERYRCDFNKDWCGSLWNQDGTDVFDWTRNRGPTPVANTGPSEDHISKVDVTYQISVQSNCKYTTINKASGRFTSPGYPEKYSNNQNCEWLLTSNGRISLSFESFATEHCCDRVYVYDGGSKLSKLLGDFSGNRLPSNLSSSSYQLFVVFNSDGSDTDRGFSAKYASAGKASGYYIYTDTNKYRKFGDTARFVSKLLPATKNTCLSFWYHMYGRDINTLRVILKTSLKNTTVWSRRNDSGNRWLEEKLNFATTKNYQLVFEGVAGSGILGHIALDDISIYKGSCNNSNITETTPIPSTTATTKRTSTIKTTTATTQRSSTSKSTEIQGITTTNQMPGTMTTPETSKVESHQSSTKASTTKPRNTNNPSMTQSVPDKKRKQSVLMRVKNMLKEKWSASVLINFKKTVAALASAYCRIKKEMCGIPDSRRSRRTNTDQIYNVSNVHLLPGYPQQTGSDLLIAFYVLNPSGSNSSVLPGIALMTISNNGQANISKVIGYKVTNLGMLVGTSANTIPTTAPSEAWNGIVIGVCCAVLALIIIVILVILYIRKKNSDIIETEGVDLEESHDERYQPGKDDIELGIVDNIYTIDI